MPGCIRVESRPGGVAVLTITKEPVNILSLDVWEELGGALADLEGDEGCKAVVFASGLKRDVFAAGLDITQLYAPLTTPERYTRYWLALNKVLVSIYNSPLVTVAAIRGACPAGGCALSMACDARLMTPQGSMGLNELELGIPVPKFWYALMAQIIGQRRADDLVLSSRMVSPSEALSLGLVDEVVDREALMSRAVEVAGQSARLPREVRGSTKQVARAAFVADWQDYYSGPELDYCFNLMSQPDTVRRLGEVLKQLKQKKGGSKL